MNTNNNTSLHTAPFFPTLPLEKHSSIMATSLQILRAFLHVLPDGTVDASQIHSPQCYAAWLASRGTQPCEAEARKFQRSLSNHLGGVDGRSPFDPEEEQAIMLVLRRKQCWPCFPPSYKIGSMGYRSKGFHEKNEDLAHKSNTTTTATTTLGAPTRKKRILAQEGEPEEKKHNAMMAKSPEELEMATASSSSSLFNLDLQVFAEHVVGYSLTFTKLGIDVSKSIFGLMRFFFWARLPLLSTRGKEEFVFSSAYAEELCAHLSQRHAGRWVTIYAAMAEYPRRIMAQNDQSKETFGDLAAQAGDQPLLIQAGDWGRLVFHLGMAHANPGKDIVVCLTFNCRDGIKRRFEVTLFVDPKSYLSAAIGSLQEV